MSKTQAEIANRTESPHDELMRLHLENAGLNEQVGDLESEVRKWAWTTAVVAMSAMGLLVVNMLYGSIFAPDCSDVESAIMSSDERIPDG